MLYELATDIEGVCVGAEYYHEEEAYHSGVK
jgi:hypothetical protein